jgi:hypothetical protein
MPSYAMSTGAALGLIILALLTVALPARADEYTYGTLHFIVINGTPPDPPTGSFVFDNTTHRMINSTVHWDGATFDFTPYGFFDFDGVYPWCAIASFDLLSQCGDYQDATVSPPTPMPRASFAIDGTTVTLSNIGAFNDPLASAIGKLTITTITALASGGTYTVGDYRQCDGIRI